MSTMAKAGNTWLITRALLTGTPLDLLMVPGPVGTVSLVMATVMKSPAFHQVEVVQPVLQPGRNISLPIFESR